MTRNEGYVVKQTLGESAKIKKKLYLTHINSHTGQEHDNRQRMEVLAPCVHTQRRNMFVSGIQQFRRNIRHIRTIRQIRQVRQVREAQP